jgi:hypothetical protein
MKNRKIKKELELLLSHLLYYNYLAPFPVFDTEYVKDVKYKLNKVMKDKDKDYDQEPVVACRFCKSLHIVSDEIDNNICMRCGAVNELQEFTNINEYLKFKHGNKDS